MNGKMYKHPKLDLVGVVQLTERQQIEGVNEGERVVFMYQGPKGKNESRNVVLDDLQEVNIDG